MSFNIRQALLSDCAPLAKRLRDDDVKEMWHASRVLPEKALVSALGNGKITYTAEWNGQATCMFGVIPRSAGIWAIWFLSAELTKVQSVEIIRESPQWIMRLAQQANSGAMRGKVEHIGNMVWYENLTHLKWLKATNMFDIIPTPIPLNDQIFFAFTLKKEFLDV